MTRKRVTKEEKQQRHKWAMKKIDQGVGFHELAPHHFSRDRHRGDLRSSLLCACSAHRLTEI